MTFPWPRLHLHAPPLPPLQIRAATHNIMAYRIHLPGRNTFLQDFDDDGETAAGGRLLHLLQVRGLRRGALGPGDLTACWGRGPEEGGSNGWAPCKAARRQAFVARQVFVRTQGVRSTGASGGGAGAWPVAR